MAAVAPLSGSVRAHRHFLISFRVPSSSLRAQLGVHVILKSATAACNQSWVQCPQPGTEPAEKHQSKALVDVVFVWIHVWVVISTVGWELEHVGVLLRQ